MTRCAWWIRTVATSGTIVLAAIPGIGSAQNPENVCNGPPVSAENRGVCLATAQLAGSAPPVIAFSVSGGSPTAGGIASPGIGLGVAPRASLSLRINAAYLRMPEIERLAGSGGANPTGSTDRLLTVPAADLTIELTRGIDYSPGYGGIGALTLIGTGGFVPGSQVSERGGESAFAWGGGLRINGLRESFVAPSIALSIVRRSLGEFGVGDACVAGFAPSGAAQNGVQPGVCTGSGDFGEVRSDITWWTVRAQAAKTFGTLAASGGLGADIVGARSNLVFRGQSPTAVFQIPDYHTETTRWSGFANLSYTLVVVALTAEVAWQSGGDQIEGFQNLGSAFDPGKGTWLGSVGARVGL